MIEITPSENEWQIMEVVWNSHGSMTAAEIINELKDVLDVSQKTVRVMINRLVAKGMLGYQVDEYDSRIYHYNALKTREECLEIKSDRFVKNYFGGKASLAVASFLQSAKLSAEELNELDRLLLSLKASKISEKGEGACAKDAQE